MNVRMIHADAVFEVWVGESGWINFAWKPNHDAVYLTVGHISSEDALAIAEAFRSIAEKADAEPGL